MKYVYSFQQFSDAIRIMATSPSSIQQRVADAYINSLTHIKINELPEEIWG